MAYLLGKFLITRILVVKDFMDSKKKQKQQALFMFRFCSFPFERFTCLLHIK